MSRTTPRRRHSSVRRHRSQHDLPERREATRTRGPLLTAVLILIAVHGVFTAVLLLSLRKAPDQGPPVWLWVAALILALADITAAVALWRWRKWGLWLYAASQLASIAVGLVALPFALAAFHGIVPLGILAYVLSYQRKMQLLT